MMRTTERAARRLGTQIKKGPDQRSPVEGREDELRSLVSTYPNYDPDSFRVECKPVPRPDYEAKWGGPYSHIVTVWYCDEWAACYGLTVTGKFVLWMD